MRQERRIAFTSPCPRKSMIYSSGFKRNYFKIQLESTLVGTTLHKCYFHPHLPARGTEGCLKLDMTCVDHVFNPCCPGMVCRKSREGARYGRCSVSWAEFIKLDSSSTEPLTTTTTSGPLTST
nr:conserved hypothetical protein [Hymenolepis microstoma]